MEEVKDYHLKIDLKKFFESVSTENLRFMRDAMSNVLKERAKMLRKDMPPAKPEYRFWIGKVTRRIGNALCRYRYYVEPLNMEDVPEELRKVVASTYFTLMSGVFRKNTCPKLGDVVILKYRVCKHKSDSSNFRQSRITDIAPKEVVGCKKEWNCLNIIANNDKSQCPNCPDVIMK